MYKIICAASLLLAAGIPLQAQVLKEAKWQLSDDGSRYIKFTANAQFWARHTSLNPGSVVQGQPRNGFTDIGIRRLRFQVYGQLASRIFFYTQLGENNFSFSSDRKQGFFVHDAAGEYEAVRHKLSLGMGLTGWSGLSRFASPSAGTIMGIDAPLWEQTTNDVTDQFLRKLSVYAKGKLGKTDYRLIVSQPMAAQKGNGYTAKPGIHANFSGQPPQAQWQAYVMHQFKDQESNLTPYTTGTYLGTKRVLNAGIGFIAQPRAMWLQPAGHTDTVYSAMWHVAADVFADMPLDTAKGTAISAYVCAAHLDYGEGYLRNSAPMNPANGTTMPQVIGTGNAYPAYGTGNVLYVQAGYLMPKNLIGKTTLMPYASWQYGRYNALHQAMHYTDIGVNWLLQGHTSKLTLAWQNRPVYTTDSQGMGELLTRKSAFVLQYQVFLN